MLWRHGYVEVITAWNNDVAVYPPSPVYGRVDSNAVIAGAAASSKEDERESYTVNRRFLLILSGNVEVNPGPKDLCPCDVRPRAKVLEIKCKKCDQVWHINCVGLEGITEGAVSKLSKWNCPVCLELPEKLKELEEDQNPLKMILTKMGEMQEQIHKLEEKVDTKITDQSGPKMQFNTAVQLGRVQQNVKQLVRNQVIKPKPAATDTDKYDRTLLVRKYKDKNISDSKHIRRVLNKQYKKAIIDNVRTTVHGSIFMEFIDKETADMVLEDWKLELFGGNEGAVKLKPEGPAAIIKHIYQDDITENNLVAAVKENYPDTEVELFKDKDKEFTGTVKVIFKSQDQLENALKNRVDINQHLYAVDRWEHRPRVVRCFNCHKFAHIARLCRHTGTICGKCSSTAHATKACTVTPANYKCVHCGGNHETGSKVCEVMKLKTEELKGGQWL